ncbi:MAG: holo-ACP synthase [Deltaproteobacteria bacterium]|nr:holo-ACP synthase [Deltaproteobacteria bacterium]
MIYGIGVDLVKISRIDQSLARWGDRFLHKVYTPAEAEICLERPRPASCLALRFAAKEAFSKAVGLGMRNGVYWTDIEVVHNSLGRPSLVLYRKAREIIEQNGITNVFVTLTDEADMGVAVVILEV